MRYGHWLTAPFRESIQMVADGIGLKLDGIATSLQTVNSVPYVCAAPSGIKTFIDLSWIFGRGAAHASTGFCSGSM